MKYNVTLVESAEGWAAWCDDLPGCCSQGTTRANALDNIRDAIREYLAAKGQPLPSTPTKDAIYHEEVLV